ncbi:MAG: DsrE/DsrF/DrsH-like family protein [Fidelibacterota bacterium]
MAKVAITCNGAEGANIFPPMIIGSSAAALGDEVIIFFTPAGAPTMLKGKLEALRGAKGLPDIVELYEGLRALGGKIFVCELALEAKDLRAEDFREGVEIVGATTFLNEAKDATLTFSF